MNERGLREGVIVLSKYRTSVGMRCWSSPHPLK